MFYVAQLSLLLTDIAWRSIPAITSAQRLPALSLGRCSSLLAATWAHRKPGPRSPSVANGRAGGESYLHLAIEQVLRVPSTAPRSTQYRAGRTSSLQLPFARLPGKT